jgi:putative transposase
MSRSARIAPGGMVFHVLNRRVDSQPLFNTPADYRAFEEILAHGVAEFDMRLCAFCLMPNHWHLVLWPRLDGQLSDFMQLVTVTHTARWKVRHDSVGRGHLYQGRFKSFPVQSDEHYLTVVRYVERNALRANLVARAEQWQFSSLWRRRTYGIGNEPLLDAGPIELPADWETIVNEPQTHAELESLRRSVHRGNPYGTSSWRDETVRKLGLGSTLRSRGRPRHTK